MVPQVVEAGTWYREFPGLVREIRPWKDLCTLWALVRFFREERFEIVHTHSAKAGILGRFAARLAGVLVILQSMAGLFGGYGSQLDSRGLSSSSFWRTAAAMSLGWMRWGLRRNDGGLRHAPNSERFSAGWICAGLRRPRGTGRWQAPRGSLHGGSGGGDVGASCWN